MAPQLQVDLQIHTTIVISAYGLVLGATNQLYDSQPKTHHHFVGCKLQFPYQSPIFPPYASYTPFFRGEPWLSRLPGCSPKALNRWRAPVCWRTCGPRGPALQCCGATWQRAPRARQRERLKVSRRLETDLRMTQDFDRIWGEFGVKCGAWVRYMTMSFLCSRIGRNCHRLHCWVSLISMTFRWGNFNSNCKWGYWCCVSEGTNIEMMWIDQQTSELLLYWNGYIEIEFSTGKVASNVYSFSISTCCFIKIHASTHQSM